MKKLYTTKKPTKAKKKTVTRYCSMCGKAGHTKTNCPKVKKAKKINNISQYGYISQSQSEDESDQEETSQSESDQENSEIESQETNCFNLKKKVGFLNHL